MNPSIHLLKTRQPLRQIARAALLTTLIASQAFGIGDFNPRPPLPNLIGLGQGTSTIGFQLSPGQIETIRRRVEFMPDFSPAARASRPTLVLLIHGRTARPEDAPSAFDPPLPASGFSNRPGSIGYSRFYWDFPFVSAMLGGASSLFTMNGGGANRLMGPVAWKLARIENGRPGEAVNSDIANQFAFGVDPAPLRGRFTGTAAALVRANGSIALGQMAGQVLKEIKDLRDAFASYAGSDPYLVLVGHSKGGLVIRYLLSNPADEVAGYQLSAGERAIIEELRNDTRYAMTVSTPHTGSPVADTFQEVRAAIDEAEGLANRMVDSWNQTRDAAQTFGINLPAATPVDLSDAKDAISNGEDDLGHLSTAFTNQMNGGPLHPRLMIRSDGTRIPFYLYGGRAAGGAFFQLGRTDGLDVRDFVNRAQSINPEIRVPATSAGGLMALDFVLHNAVFMDWGRLVNAGSSDKPLDLVRRSFVVYFPGLRPRMSEPGERSFLNLEGLPTYYLRNRQDAETDNDGMVGIDSALGIGLFSGPVAIEDRLARRQVVNPEMMEPFDHTGIRDENGRIDLRGAWYRMYNGDWNFTNHFDIIKRPELGQEARRLLNSAGPHVSSGPLSVWPAR
ncbi:MAG: hypothetical protein ACK5S4_01055 [bacterium]